MDVNSVIGLMETCTNKKQFELLVLLIDEEIDAIHKRNFPKPKRVRKEKWLWENDTTFSPQTLRCGTLLAKELQSTYGVFPVSVGKLELIKKLRNFNGDNNAFDPDRIDLKQAKEFIEQYFAKWC